MEDNKQISAKEFIDQQYGKFFYGRDETFPKSLMENFDVDKFAYQANYRDVYNLLMNCDPFREVDDFYKLLNAENRNIGKIKSFTFDWTDSVVRKYSNVNDICIKHAEEADTIPIEGEPKDSTELDIVAYIDIQYNDEIKRIIYLMKKFIERAKEIISSIDSIGNDELDIKQVKLLILLDDMKDTRNVDSDRLLKGAIYIYKQLQVNVLDDNVVNKLCDACA